MSFQQSPRDVIRLFFQHVADAGRGLTPREREEAWREAWKLTQWTWRAGFSMEALPPPFTERIRRALKRQPIHQSKDIVKSTPEDLAREIGGLKIIRLEGVGRVRIIAGPRCEVPVIVKTANHGRQVLRPYLICETAPFCPSLIGEWGVNPVSCLRIGELESGEHFTPSVRRVG